MGNYVVVYVYIVKYDTQSVIKDYIMEELANTEYEMLPYIEIERVIKQKALKLRAPIQLLMKSQ